MPCLPSCATSSASTSRSQRASTAVFFEARIRSLGNGEKARRIKRYYCANAFDAQLDAQGRILIPGNLREFACLEKDVTVVGLLDHAEIWDTEKWNEYNGSIDAESISADMEGIDF